MKVLTLFVATPGPADGVRDVMRDLSAAELVSPFVWVDDSRLGDAGDPIPAVETVRGVERTVTLQDVLASRHHDLVRLCVLVPSVAGTVPVRLHSETMLAELVSANSGGARCIRLRLLLHRPGDVRSGLAAPALAGWHNLLVAPEDSRGPGMGHESLISTIGPVDTGRHAAPVVAGVAGLWTDIEHAPFDDEPVLPGNSLRVVRSFYRRLDTSRAEHQLHTELLDFGGQLPLPRDAGTAVLYADDVPAASRQMTQALWTKHRHLLTGARITAPAAAAPRTVSFGDALRMFGRFVLAVLTNAPARLLDRIATLSSAALASTTQTALFGSTPGAYRVVVGGIDADGQRVAWTEYEAASRQIGHALDNVKGVPQSAAPDLSALWRDYARAALTLADASERSPGLPPIQVGAHRAVLRSASDIVPGPADDFTDIPGVVSATVHTHAVEASDVLGVAEMCDRLRGLEQDPVIGLDARRTGAAIKSWSATARRSFASTVGATLADQLTSDLSETRTLLERVKNAQEVRDPAEECAEEHRRMFRKVHISSIVAVVVGVVAGALAWQEVISWWAAGPIIALGVLGWAAAVAVICRRSQQFLEDLLARREAATAAAEADRANLRVVLREVEVLTGAYKQYLSWNRALGAFLAKPLGTPEHHVVSRRRIDWGLPRHSAIGWGSPTDQDASRVADELRQDLFTVGWLTDPWDTLVGSAGTALGVAARDVERDPSLLAVKAGAGSGSPLDAWSTLLHRGQLESTGATVLWDRAMSELSGSRSELARELLRVVEYRVDGVLHRTGMDDFLAGVGTDTEAGFFDRRTFSDTASMKGLARVAGEVTSSTTAGCGLVAVTTQYTEGIAAEDLALPHAAAASVEITEFPDLALRPAQPVDTRADRPAARTFNAPVVDGINF